MAMAADQIKELESLLLKRDKEILLLKSHITLLEKSFLNIETEYSTVKASYNSIMSKENYFKGLETKFGEKDEQIFKLNQELEALTTKFQKQRLDCELQYEKDVNQVKYFYENNIAKFEYANKIEGQCKMLYDHIRELEEVILTYSNEEKKRFKDREIQFDKEVADIKKKMLDYIKEGQKKGYSYNNKQMELNGKLNKLHNGQLLNELEFQSKQIEGLLRQKDSYEKIILELRNDIGIHIQVERALTEKNKRYNEVIKQMQMQLELKGNKGNDNRRSIDKEDKEEGNCNSSGSINNNNVNGNKTLTLPPCIKDGDTVNNNKTPINQLRVTSFDITRYPLSKSNELVISRKDKDKENNNKISTIMSPIIPNIPNNTSLNYEGVKSIYLQKELIKKENDCHKLKCSLYKYKGMEHRYRNLFYLFEEALEKVYNDPQFTKVKEIYINLEDFKTCEFSLMTQEQKYSALVLLIDYILPLINKDIIASEKIKKSLERVEKKFILCKDESVKTYTSLADTKTSNHSTKNIKFKSVHDYMYNSANKKKRKDNTNSNYNTNEDKSNTRKVYSLLNI